jgi:hypothetical protein
MPTCYCLVPDNSATRVLLESGPDGWTLPAVEHLDDWFAEEAVSVARQLGQRLGIRLVALREIEEGGLRLCELENLTAEWSPPNGCQWLDGRAARTHRLAPPPLRALPLDWFRRSDPERTPAARAPWEQRGWYGGAVAWIEEQLARLNYSATGPVEQVKTAWSCSSILRVPTTDGYLYFKANYARPPAEASVIQELARRWQRHVPTLVAVDESRRWMLMEDFGSRHLARMPFGRWPGALRLFGRIQRECSERLSAWWIMACPDRRMSSLVHHMEPLFAESLLTTADPPFRLCEADLKRLLADRKRWADELLELGASPLPVSIVQQDFRDGNVAVRGRDYVFYDWSDTVVSHPFFSACRFLEFVPTTGMRPKRGAGRRLPTAVRHDRLVNA